MYRRRSSHRAISSGVLFRPFFKRLLQKSQDLLDVHIDVRDCEEHSPNLFGRYRRFPFHERIVPTMHPSLKTADRALS
jgi:hypothetical protein